MKILFLNPPFLPRFSRSQRSPAVTKSGTLYYPLWLAYAAGCAEKAGFDVKLIDAPAECLTHSHVKKIIKSFSPELIVSDTSTPTIEYDITFAEELKTLLPSSFIVLVGAHVSAMPQETLEQGKNINAIARGEYDFTILELAKAIQNTPCDLAAISGLSYHKNDEIIHNPDRPPENNLDAIPFVSAVYQKHLKIKNYFFAASLYPEVQILTARGCPFRCFFCLWPQTFQGRAYRARSPQNVLEEFLFIKNNLPEVKSIVIEDDTFTVNKKRVAEICDLLIKHKVNIPWNANVRTNLDFETMKKMKDAGCYLLIVGIETTDETILQNISKGVNAADIQPFFDRAKSLGLLVHAAFMAGNPGETKETLEKSLRFAKKYLPDTIQFFPLTPYPGTQAYTWAKEHGTLKIRSFKDYLTPDGLHNCIIGLPGLAPQEIMNWCQKARISYYLNPRYLAYKFFQILFTPQQALRTIKAFLVFKKHLLKNTSHD